MNAKVAILGFILMLSAGCWGQSTLPTLDDCDKTALVAGKLFDALGKTQDWAKKAALIHSNNADTIEKRLASCRLVAMTRSDITRLNNYADLQTWLMAEDYDTLYALTNKLQAECLSK